MFNGLNKIRITPTRIAGLGYGNTNPAGAALWRFIDTSEKREASVGPIYTSKAQLLADFSRYAIAAGWEREPVENHGFAWVLNPDQADEVIEGTYATYAQALAKVQRHGGDVMRCTKQSGSFVLTTEF